MSLIRTAKFISYNKAKDDKYNMWYIVNDKTSCINKKNRTVISVVIENFSYEDFGSVKHSAKRALLFKSSAKIWSI